MGEKIAESIDAHNRDGTAHEGILEKLDDLDTEVLNVKGDVKILKETTATDEEVALAVSEHNANEGAHPAIRSAIAEVSNDVKNLNVDGKIADALFSHNTNDESHNDIRILLQELFDQVNHFLDVDDTKKDQLSELLALIDENIEDIENIVANNVKYNDIIDNLTTNLDNKALSAAQGVELKRLIEEVRTAIATAINAHNYDGNAHAGILESLDTLDTAVTNLNTKVTALENAKPDMSGYVTTEQFETALGAYITDIDSLVGSGA
jgi:DNA helicase IV